jgi:hypothetical protein
MQAYLWQHVFQHKPNRLEPITLDGSDGGLMPVLSKLFPAPQSLYVVVKCGCQKAMYSA